MKIYLDRKEWTWRFIGFVLFIPFFKPQYFSATGSILSVIYNYYLYVAIVIVLILYVGDLVSKREMPSPIMVLIVCYSIVLVMSSLLKNGYWMNALKEGVAYIALFALSEMLLKQSIEMFISVVSPILNLLVILNFVSMLIWPDGMYKTVLVSESIWYSKYNWILGYDNGFIFHFLPVLMLSFIKNVCIKKTIFSKISLLLMIGVCVLPIVIRQQAASIVGMAIFLGLIILVFMECMPKMITPRIYWGVYIAIFLCIVVFRLQDLFAVLIEDVLGKNLTFTGRTYIWDLSLEALMQSPIFGYGIEDIFITVERISVDSPHNLFLWILYRGGLVQFLIFILLIQLVIKNLQNNREKLYVKITTIAVFSIFVVSLVEASREHSMFLMFIFAYYVGKVPLKQKRTTENLRISGKKVLI